MKGKKHALFFTLLLFLSYKVNAVLLKEIIKNFLECTKEHVKGKNAYKLTEEHPSITGNILELWKSETNENTCQKKIKFKHDAIKIKIKYAQIFRKRANRILREVIHGPKNFGNSSHKELRKGNKNGENKDGEHKTYNKTHKGRYRNSLLMINNDASRRGQHSEQLDNALGSATGSEVNYYDNSSKDGTPYGVNHKIEIHSGVINHEFRENPIMKSCPMKRNRLEKDWGCQGYKDVCVPDRRYLLCVKEIANLLHNVDDRFHSDKEFRKTYLKRKLIYDAEEEAALLLKKYNNKYNENLCNDIKSSWADFGYIIMGTDVENIGYSIVVGYNLRRVFGNDDNAKLSRKHFWNDNKIDVWEAMINSVKKGSTGNVHWSCKMNDTLDIVPQIHSWIREWGRDYRSELSLGLPQVINKCNGKINNTDKKVCTVPECQKKCEIYDKWLKRKKKQWDILSNKFKDTKNMENIQKENNETAYDVLRQELNGVTEEDFVNDISSRGNTYIELCICGIDGFKNVYEYGVIDDDTVQDINHWDHKTERTYNGETVSAPENSLDRNVTNRTGESHEGRVALGHGNDMNTQVYIQGNDITEDLDMQQSEWERSDPIADAREDVADSENQSLRNSSRLTSESEIDENNTRDDSTDTASGTLRSRDSYGTLNSTKLIVNPGLKGIGEEGMVQDNDMKTIDANSNHSDSIRAAGEVTTDTVEYKRYDGRETSRFPEYNREESRDTLPQIEAESLGETGGVHRRTTDTSSVLAYKHFGNEKDFQTHNLKSTNKMNGAENFDQNTGTKGYNRDNNKSDNLGWRNQTNKDTSTKNPTRNNVFTIDKLDIKKYKYRDVNATREKIIHLSEVRKCSNSVSLKYCNLIEDKVSSSACSRDEIKHLCCSISDFCLTFFVAYSQEYRNCVKREFDDPAYKCFIAVRSLDNSYFAGGSILLILALLLSSTKMINNNSEESTFDEFEEHCDSDNKCPEIVDSFENIQPTSPLDYY
ncbi:Duffy receptor precursor [Plasmodium gonderi]|uniref:Erythrocyte-binding protein n=1 Tax=Plasmodium gonderi TaxID=77519 RepID=A0A1Y1JJ13_PLAGO|nr:Duffy receptor precursor [Plasmodium gonderi]GAW80084.1 Duffy receptor precursor [Plasmodium gonderi]